MRTEKVGEQGQLLSSWKEIAVYLGRTIRTCQRLESGMGLPVHRLDGSPKAHVFAYKNELDAWMAQKVDEHEEERRKPRRLLFYGIGGAAVVAVAALLIITLKPGSPPRSIAVMPFDDLSSEPGFGYFAQGVTEDLTGALGGIEGLLVSSRLSAAAVKEQKLEAQRAGRILNVRNLVEGSVEVTGDRVRIVASLVHAGNGFRSWTRAYDGRRADYFDIVEKITRAVADHLGETPSAGEGPVLVKRPTADTQAYELYMTGRYLLGLPKPEAPGQALSFFVEALRRDPKFAQAKAGIAWAYMNMMTLFSARPNEMGPKAEAAAREALDLDPNLAEAHAVNGWVQFIYKWNWDAADRSFRRALELKPDEGITRGWYAYLLFSRRRFREARFEITRALASDPFIPYLHGLAMWIHVHTGGTEEVLKEFNKVQEIAPDFSFAYFGAGLAYLLQGRLDESVEMFKRGCLFPGTRGWPEAGLVAAYLRKGDRKSAEDVYAKLLQEWEKTGLVSPVHVAWAAAAMGDIDRACELVEEAAREHDPSVVVVHVTARTLVPHLVQNPCFLAVLDKVGLPH